MRNIYNNDAVIRTQIRNAEEYGQLSGKYTENSEISKEENKVWFNGRTEDLIYFYKYINTNRRFGMIRNFYNVANINEYSILHMNIPEVISDTMSNILFGKEVTIKINTGKKTLDKELNSRLSQIMYDNDFENLLKQASTMESYSGAVAFKISLDKSFMESPIVECYPKEEVDVVKKYNKVLEIIFKNEYCKDDKTYTLKSIYGRGYIKYKLIDDKGNKVSLSTIDELANLKDIIILDKDTMKPTNRLLAVYKENKIGGKSDYAGLYDSFMAIDEIFTMKQDLIEKSGIRQYIPTTLCARDVRSGNNNPIVPKGPNMHTYLLHKQKAGDSDKIETEFIDIANQINAYDNSINNLVQSTIRNAGLSPASTGLMEDTGANSSAEAILARDAATMRTRDSKIALWKPALQDLAELLINFSTLESFGDKYVIENYDNEVIVEFPKYNEYERLASLVTCLKTATDANLMSESKALEIMNTEFYHMDEEDLELMKMEINDMLVDEDSIVNKAATENEEEIEVGKEEDYKEVTESEVE